MGQSQYWVSHVDKTIIGRSKHDFDYKSDIAFKDGLKIINKFFESVEDEWKMPWEPTTHASKQFIRICCRN